MIKDSAGFRIPSYFSGISSMNVRTDGQRTCHSSHVKAGQPTSKGRHPPTPSIGWSTLRPSYSSVRGRSSRRCSTTRTSPLRLSSGARRWPGHARESEEAIEASSGSYSCYARVGCHGGDCTVGTTPSVRPVVRTVAVVWGGRGGPAHREPPATAKPSRLWMVARHSSICSAAGGNLSNS